MSAPIRKKLIEVALPLPEINDASAYDKMPGIGPHPKGIHHWWARLPLPCARSILFASVVDDPSEHPEKFPTEAAQDAERERLFDIVRRMMQKKLHTHPEVYAEARAEMEKYCDGKLPAVLDPFSGGGSIPLEANRLGFEAHATDLNPVAVLLNKCNLELAPRWSGQAPINPDDRRKIGGGQSWHGTTGLAADVRHYAKRIKESAENELDELYPKATLPAELGGGPTDVVAWLWARTVRSDNAAAQGKHVPLVSTYFLANGKGKEVYLEPQVDKSAGTYRFALRTGTPDDKTVTRAGTKLGRGAKFKCLLTDSPISSAHIKAEGQAGRLGYKLLAIVAERRGGKFYQAANAAHEAAANVPVPDDAPDEEMANDPRNIWCAGYGFRRFSQLFTPRQLTGLLTFSRLIRATHADIIGDAQRAGLSSPEAEAYATTVVTFLALALDRCADFGNAQGRWSPSNQKVMNLFSKQAIPMSWDFAEANILANSVGGWTTCSDYVAECIQTLYAGPAKAGFARQIDAASGAHGIRNLVVSTDPPYYDNMSYASLSDFFYVWLRRTVGDLHRELCSTIVVPKMPELIADAARFEGDRNRARDHFENGFRSTFSFLRDRLDPRYPLTVYYAFKQEDEAGDASIEQDGEEGAVTIDLTTGWETLLEALISSGFQITATWPVRASQAWRQVSMGTNALASYIVLACRPRPESATQVGRRDFLTALKRELPVALKHLQQGNVAPVDLAQASIGPGMAVYSRYSRILESDGKAMTVRTALALINQIKEEVLGEPENDYDAETRWALTWFDQHGFEPGDFGDANTLATAHAIAVGGLREAGIVQARGGDVRLLNPGELPKDWDPATDDRLTVWEMTHHLIRLYHVEGAGDGPTANLLRKLGGRADTARDLAYRLFSVAERRKRSADAQGYNALVLGWPELSRLAQEAPAAQSAPAQGEFL
jgi:putative DNA methylase